MAFAPLPALAPRAKAFAPWAMVAALAGCSSAGGGPGGTGRDARADDVGSPVSDATTPLDAAITDAGSEDAPVDTTPPGDRDASFDGALWINDSPDCGLGEIGATYRGIPAFCQPFSLESDGFYQCDELANRFLRDALQHPDLDNVETDYASSMCARAEAMPAYSVWGPGYGDTTGKTPVGGDLVVYPGMPGHVVVVVGFATPIYVTVLQQNDGPTVNHEQFDPATSFFIGAECWIHPEPAPPAELPDAACSCFTGGDTCGLALVDHEWWNGCRFAAPEGGVHYDTLYACDGGAVTAVKTCPSRCVTGDIFDASGACGM